MKRIKVIALLLVPMLVLGAFVLALSGLLPYKVYAVQTGSMAPTIPPTSAVIVEPGAYQVGHAISFYENGRIVTHRLVAIHPDGTTDTKGDANATIDPWHVSTKAIIGEVVAAPAHLGYWLVYLRNPAGLMSILIAVLLCWQIWSFAGSEKQPAELSKARPRGRSRRLGGAARAEQTA
jgi:signal peptidase